MFHFTNSFSPFHFDPWNWIASQTLLKIFHFISGTFFKTANSRSTTNSIAFQKIFLSFLQKYICKELHCVAQWAEFQTSKSKNSFFFLDKYVYTSYFLNSKSFEEKKYSFFPVLAQYVMQRSIFFLLTIHLRTTAQILPKNLKYFTIWEINILICFLDKVKQPWNSRWQFFSILDDF